MRPVIIALLAALFAPVPSAVARSARLQTENEAVLTIRSRILGRELKLDAIFYETSAGRQMLPRELTSRATNTRGARRSARMGDGRLVTVSVQPAGANHFKLQISAEPGVDIMKWGLAIEALDDEYYTGLMERVVDGPQRASWAPGIKEAMDLRGQKVEMVVKPTTSLYAPFYISSRGYGVFVKGTWPGYFDFCATNPERVKVEFEGPTLEMKLYTASEPATLVQAHALDAGLPFLPPRWMFSPWRWRDEHTQRDRYYDGTPVTGPFNSEVMEDVLMMQALGIPCGVYWIDRPWGLGSRWGYDDFEIDPKRLPNFREMVKWLNQNQMEMLLWIAPFYQGRMMDEALAKGYNLAGQERPENGNNYPMVDFTNPQARKFWQDGISKLLNLGVAAFKLDRGEEDIPESGPYKLFDGRSIRENRNAYVAMYVKAVYDVAKRHRGGDFVLMPRGAYTGSSAYGVFWGGDIGGTQEGLRASIIAAQRAAVMGYPNWGADTCGYNEQLLEQEVCARWLAFSCFTPIMEVGPTRNVGFWNLPRAPQYDAQLIAIWRLYARLHQRLAGYGYKYAQVANRTGMPIIRPLWLVDPQSRHAWTNWWTYLYGPDVLVSPIWEKGKREQEVYFPNGSCWRDVWHRGKTYEGGTTATVHAELYQIPMFIREGSAIKPGDLHREYRESLAIAQRKPDLSKLDAAVREWFERNKR